MIRILYIIYYVYYLMSNPLIYVIDAFNDNIKCNVKFTEYFMKCKIEINLAGLKPNS